MSNKIFLAAAGVVVLAAIFVWAGYKGETSNACHDFQQGKLVTSQTTLNLAIVTTQTDQARGLGGCTAVPEKSGMYFPYTTKATPAFWMKDMVIPIDIVWLADGKVLGVTASIPAPRGNVSNEDLLRYYPPQAIDGVLEVGAGKAQEYGLNIGTAFQLIH